MNPVDIHACLADPTRYRMVHLLLPGPLCVKHFQAILGVSQVSASRHLAYLKRRGLVEVHRKGVLRVHSLPTRRDAGLAAHLRCLGECAAVDATCGRDLARRSAMADKIRRDVSGRLEAVAPRRPYERPPEVPREGSTKDSTGTATEAWPSADDGPLLD